MPWPLVQSPSDYCSVKPPLEEMCFDLIMIWRAAHNKGGGDSTSTAEGCLQLISPNKSKGHCERFRTQEAKSTVVTGSDRRLAVSYCLTSRKETLEKGTELKWADMRIGEQYPVSRTRGEWWRCERFREKKKNKKKQSSLERSLYGIYYSNMIILCYI